MSNVHVQLFGRFCIQRDGQVIAGFEAHKLQELFSYVLLHRHYPLSREVLASVLWPDTTTAQSKKKLRQLLWHLHCALGSQTEPPHARLLLIEPDQVQINAEADLWLDIAVFEKSFSSVGEIPAKDLSARDALVLNQAVQLYRGPFMEGFYEDWCLSQREQFQSMCLTMVEKLMSHCELYHDYDAAIRYGTGIIKSDKVHERTYRRLMRLYYLNGERTKALRLYEQCVTALDEELGVKPSKHTLALYRQILAEQLTPLNPITHQSEAQPAPERSDAPLVEALDHLTHLQKLLADLQNQVQQSVQQLEQAVRNTAASSTVKVIDAGKDSPETLKRQH